MGPDEVVNSLVNFQSRVAKERGNQFIYIESSQFPSDADSIKVRIVSEQWVLTWRWTIYFCIYFFTCTLAFAVTFVEGDVLGLRVRKKKNKVDKVKTYMD